MKKFFLLGLIFLVSLTGCSRKEKEGQKLEERLEEMLKVTEQKDFEKILDYTYPKVFEFASRAQLKEALKAGFEAEDFTTSLDSVKIKKIHPVFTMKDAQYAKIIHTLRMHMKFKQPLDSAESQNYVDIMQTQFGTGNVSFDMAANTLLINTTPELVAVKDKHSKEWSFVNYNENDKLTGMLFSNEVTAKLREYK